MLSSITVSICACIIECKSIEKRRQVGDLLEQVVALLLDDLHHAAVGVALASADNAVLAELGLHRVEILLIDCVMLPGQSSGLVLNSVGLKLRNDLFDGLYFLRNFRLHFLIHFLLHQNNIPIVSQRCQLSFHFSSCYTLIRFRFSSAFGLGICSCSTFATFAFILCPFLFLMFVVGE